MILLDFSQIIIAATFAMPAKPWYPVEDGSKHQEDKLRHMVLNSIRSYQKKYSSEYGKIVLCADASRSWRKDCYPEYKANRKKNRATDKKRDWNAIFQTLDKIKQEIQEKVPYTFIKVAHAEADDVIAVLTKAFYHDGILIISGDKDFQQLQKYPNVKQWSPNLKKFVKPECPRSFLLEHILRGDKSDGIPNVLSDDDCFTNGKRQTPLKKKVVEQYIKNGVVQDDKYYRNYRRNQTLIDLDEIPESLETEIMNQFELQSRRPKPSGKIFDYLRVNRLNDLMDNIGDFSL